MFDIIMSSFLRLKLAKFLQLFCFFSGKWPTNSTKNILDFKVMADYNVLKIVTVEGWIVYKNNW